jgi:hypothetical protein
MPTEVDIALKDWATPRQAEYIDAINAHGGYRAAAKALGASQGSISDAIKAVKKKAARGGYAPGHFHHGTAPGYLMGKVTVQRGRDGDVERTWERQSPDAARWQEALQAASAAMAEDLPRLLPVPAPATAETRLCNLFTITDYHVGMLAWEKEAGDDWDLRIAEDTLAAAFGHLISSSPRARVAVVNQLGDFLHQDSNKAVTPTHGHLLDADSRFRKIVGVAIRVLRRVIDAALATHDEVHVIMAEGNHDEVSSIWLQAMFAALYENEPRVTVNDSALPYYVYRHGRTMLGFHHGHMKKNDGLPLHFAASYPEIWGQTAKRYIHVGHRHHVEEKEHAGVKVVQHSTLAARDAYAARGGWHSERQAIAITYHEEHGEVARATVTPGMLH